MTNQQAIEKSFYEQLSEGHYLDVKFTDNEWKMAKVIQRDKQYATVSIDGLNSKDEQIFLNSFRNTPFRLHTEGYTGSLYRPYRNASVSASVLPQYIEILKTKYLTESLPSAFVITQYLRGEVFVLVHEILCREAIKNQEVQQIMNFLYEFVSFVIKFGWRVKKLANEYFQTNLNGKLVYLSNEKIAAIYSLSQLFWLVNLLLKTEQSRIVNLINHKSYNHEKIMQIVVQQKGQTLAFDLLKLTDQNGKWFPLNIQKRAYYLIKTFKKNVALPQYKLKDYQQAFGIYLFIIKQQQKANEVEQKLLKFCIQCLKQPCAFQGKLRAIQQIRKMVEGQTKLYRIDQKSIIDQISKQSVIDRMIDEYNFNPQIFKRMIPILQRYSKYKSIPSKTILSFFKLVQKRHVSEEPIINEIICELAGFVQVSVLDSMFHEIIKQNINNEQTLKFLKDYTIKAILNYSNQKSFLSSFFGKSKNSSQYGYYGLDLLFKQIQDDGKLQQKYLPFAFEIIRQFFQQDTFKSQRQAYYAKCINWLKYGKNFPQGIKIIDIITSTYPESTFISETKYDVLKKLQDKNKLLDTIIFGLQKVKEGKIGRRQTIKFAFEFLDNYYNNFSSQIGIEHIQTLWMLNESKLMSNFIRKNEEKREWADKKKNQKDKFVKRLTLKLQEDIIKKLARNPAFYNRQLAIEEFQSLDEIFISVNLFKNNITISENGAIRYVNPMTGEDTDFYFNFLKKMGKSEYIDKLINRTIQIFIRNKDHVKVQQKVNTWKYCLQKLVSSLKDYPDACLKAVALLFQLIKGRTVKLVQKNFGTISVKIMINSKEHIIILEKSSTIYKLRQTVAQQLNITDNFIFYSPSMKRDIYFAEEEDYSVNVLNNTNSSNEKMPTLHLVKFEKEVHPQVQAEKLFRKTVQTNQKLYELLFSLNSQSNVEVFWKTVDLLPPNIKLVNKILNCQQFTIQQWKSIFTIKNLQSLLYYFNIIKQLVSQPKWLPLFVETEGLLAIIQCLSSSLQLAFTQNIKVVLECFYMISNILDLQNVTKLKFKREKTDFTSIVKELQLAIVAILYYFFGQKDYSIQSNVLLHLFQILNKLVKLGFTDKFIDLQLMLLVLTYCIFLKKTKVSTQLFEREIINYLVNTYRGNEQKEKIYDHLTANLSQAIQQKQHCEHLFGVLIDYMNTFVEPWEMELIHKPEYFERISRFIMRVLRSEAKDSGSNKHDEVIVGTLKLLLFTLKQANTAYDMEEILSILLRSFLFNPVERRAKSQVTLKALFDLIKKIIFIDNKLIGMLIQQISPRLQQAKWRNNTYLSWSIDGKPLERNIYCGIENLGATCYINCLVQQLAMIDQFRDQFISVDSKNWKENQSENEILQFQTLLTFLWKSKKRSANTRKFCQSFITYEGTPINPMIQSDADQFLNQLMEKLQTFLKAQKRHDIVENSFEGSLSNQLICEGCPHRSEKAQNFLTLGVNIKGKKTLQEALQGYVEGQVLDGDNAYFCQTCQKKVKTLKRLCINKLPNVLIIVLKRFQFNYDEMRRTKINARLNFPFEVDMHPYTAEGLQNKQLKMEKGELKKESQYKLRGTVIHSGTADGGHYYSFIKDKEQWYSFNDEFVEPIDQSKVEEEGFGGESKVNNQNQFRFQRNRNAYILFYQKKSVEVNESKESIPLQCKQESKVENTDNPFKQWISSQIIQDNSDADFLSVMLDNNFMRLIESLSCYDEIKARYLIFLYFHTVLLRDKSKDENLPGFGRLIEKELTNSEVAQWFLSQINESYFKQFTIQAPKPIRYICTGFVMCAIRSAKVVSQDFIHHAMVCLNKNGMTPFALIFQQISKKDECKLKLIELGYVQKVKNIIFEKSNEERAFLSLNSQSYFGKECSQKTKQREKCLSSLIESLKHFTIPFEELFEIFQKAPSRTGAKIIAQKIARDISEPKLEYMLGQLELKIFHENEFKKEQIERYMFFVRQNIFFSPESQSHMSKIENSLKRIITQFRQYYDPMDLVIRQLNFISSKCKPFKNHWKTYLINNPEITKTVNGWLKDAERPQSLYKSQQVKRKILNLESQQRNIFFQQNNSRLEKRTKWMLTKQNELQPQGYESELEYEKIQIRNKKINIRWQIGLLKRAQVQDNLKWVVIERFDIDTIFYL